MKPAASFKTILDALFDPAVRDLAWAIGSPGLPDSTFPAYNPHGIDDAWCMTQLSTCAQWLAVLDQDPRPLHDFIAARPSRRLGHYFESLVAFWLRHTPNMQILAANLQVQDANRTLGEYDFLLRDSSGTICHWEAAVKFYLQAKPLPEQRTFIGPGGQDRLDLKLDRVFRHQLGLGQTTAGRTALPAGVMPNKAQAFIKGYLFYPAALLDKYAAPTKIPSAFPIPGVSGQHLYGWWLHYPVARLPQQDEGSRWIMLPRLRWLASVRLKADNGLMSLGAVCCALDQHFSALDEAILLVELRHDENNEWREVARGFVVCNSWPSVQRQT